MFLSLWLFLPAVSLTAEPVKGQAGQEPPACELILGKHIEKLSLTNQQGQLTTYRRSGFSMFLPPGQYVIETIDLQGGYSSSPRFGYSGQQADRITLMPGKPCQFNIRAPLKPSVAVKRVGRLLKLDYQLLDGDGRVYRRNDPSGNDRIHQPQFAIYQGESKIGSGTFEYG